MVLRVRISRFQSVNKPRVIGLAIRTATPQLAKVYIPVLPSPQLLISHHSDSNPPSRNPQLAHQPNQNKLLFVMCTTITLAAVNDTTAPFNAARATNCQVPVDNGGSGQGPQCCHCGWRGKHAPTCPFK
ncbi:uncharacterized protein PHACADRAFT_255967 [Phanerochaete carnosa HHB-10118-sp]|uniref:Uncharacterized protein n=1 Tax=Phanerochaete carnosa (strain HHB-10118-sp) TaxID=650164 RepID=K5W8U4_PHACS|nr:uncharacterized protein PHACADRAFT_255967 [Phanerochaete carnosa HHB-10118-sp]EKM55379.1 hypothetical protein PHACADRAFT_255967 [Phanerochaete carnosa HHB-10118-sp]